MARIFPSDITHLGPGHNASPADAHAAELDTLHTLRHKLPGDFDIYHGVHWSREYAKRTVFGEVDFVIVNRNGDVMLIEQKNGPLAERDGQLVKSYADGEKNVNVQIRVLSHPE